MVVVDVVLLIIIHVCLFIWCFFHIKLLERKLVVLACSEILVCSKTGLEDRLFSRLMSLKSPHVC